MAFLDKIVVTIEKGEKALHKKGYKALAFGLFFVLIIALHFLFCYKGDGFYDATGVKEYGFRSRLAMWMAIALFIVFLFGLIAIFVALLLKKKLSAKRLIYLFVAVASAITLLLGGFLNFNNNRFTHDFSVYQYGGHWSIIYDIYQTGKIPGVSLDNQYYQVKFYHYVVAMFARFFSLLLPSSDGIQISILNGSSFLSLHDAQSLECIRIIDAYLGSLNFYLLAKIFLSLFKRHERKAAYMTGFALIVPAFYFVIYSGNNDLFALFFSLLSLVIALLWKEKRSFLNIIFLALAIAMGMESKLNSGLLALPIAYIFLLELYRLYFKKEGEKKERLRFWAQISLFALICIPLALGGHVYQSLKYDEPFGYVLDLERNGPNYMHVDNEYYGFFFRFLAFPSPDLFSSCYNIRAYFPVSGGSSNQYVWGTIDYNIWTAFIKTALWEEHNPFGILGTSSFDVFFIYAAYIFAVILSFLVFLFAIYYLLKYIYSLIHKEGDALPSFAAIFLLIIALSQMLAYAYFCYKYQVGCTMNARYALPLFLPFSALLGQGFTDVSNFIKEKKEERRGLFAKKNV